MSTSKSSSTSYSAATGEAAIQKVHLQLRLATTVRALLDMVAKWFGAVLIGKVLATASGTMGAVALSPFYRIVLLEPMSFGMVAGIGVGSAFVLVTTVGIEKALAARLANLTGRNLRRKVLIRAFGGSSVASKGSVDNSEAEFTETLTDIDETQAAAAPWEGDWATIASDLVRRITVVEDFCLNEEPLIFYCWLKLALSVVGIFTVLWKAGVVTLVLLLIRESVTYFVEKRRQPFHNKVEENRDSVNARMLDAIKNAVMIFFTKMGDCEASSMRELERESDEARRTDEKWRFAVELSCLPVALGPIAVPVVVWWELLGTDDPVRSFELGTAVLIALLLGDEGHKSLLQLALMFDRELAAKEATAALADFLGENPNESKGELSQKEMEVMHSSRTGATLIQASDEEMASSPARLLSSTDQFRLSLGHTEEIVLNKVTLCYPGRKNPALKDLNMTFARGKIHGLVGESGSGKSTTMKLVAGLIGPTHGHISHWDDIEIAYVSQDQSLFARTIRENVSYGAKTMPTDEDIWQALATAQIDEFVKSLPNGLDEELTEGESMISGGQLQRLHLAHLFCVWYSADLILLDECLSALDEHTRDVMIDRLQTFLRGKTAIVITHHSEMLRMCEQVHDMTPRHSPPVLARKEDLPRN